MGPLKFQGNLGWKNIIIWPDCRMFIDWGMTKPYALWQWEPPWMDSTWNWMVGRLSRFLWGAGLFSGAFAVSFRESTSNYITSGCCIPLGTVPQAPDSESPPVSFTGSSRFQNKQETFIVSKPPSSTIMGIWWHTLPQTTSSHLKGK